MWRTRQIAVGIAGILGVGAVIAVSLVWKSGGDGETNPSGSAGADASAPPASLAEGLRSRHVVQPRDPARATGPAG